MIRHLLKSGGGDRDLAIVGARQQPTAGSINPEITGDDAERIRWGSQHRLKVCRAIFREQWCRFANDHTSQPQPDNKVGNGAAVIGCAEHHDTAKIGGSAGMEKRPDDEAAHRMPHKMHVSQKRGRKRSDRISKFIDNLGERT